MQFYFSVLRQFWAVAFAFVLIPLVCSACWAGELALSPAEQAWIDAHPVIRMSVDTGYGPYIFLDGEGHLQGVATDFFADIERHLGIRFEIVSNLSWPQQMQAVRERRLDAVATVVKLPEREAFLEFTEIYLPTPLVIMTRSETPQLQAIKELQQLSLTLVQGYSSSKELIARFPELQPHYVTAPLQGLRSVASGATDAYVGVLGVNSFLAARNGIINLKVNAAFDMADNGQRFGVRKDWPQLARLLDKALLAISVERRNAIFQRWLPRHAGEIERLRRPGYVTRLFPWLLGGLGLTLVGYLVLFVLNRQLRKIVETRTQELLKTNKKLHDSEERYRTVAEDTPVLICRFLPGGEITYANEAYCRYFEKTSEELVGSSIIELIPEAERQTVMANISAMTVDSRNQSHEHQVIGAEGEIRWTRWTNRALFDAQGKAVAFHSIGEDITERKQAELELEKYRNHLEELVEKRTEELKEKTGKIEKSSKALTYLLEDVNESRDDLQKINIELVAVNQELKEFAYIVSHDLKAPLRAISQLTHWISEDYSAVFDDDGKQQMGLILQRVKRMDGLIDGVLRYSRVGRIKEKTEQLDLNLLVNEIVDNIAPPDTVQVIIENKLPVVLRDPTRMGQVFQNLIGNAIKFMDKDEGIVKVGCVDEGALWKFSVADNGPGIDKRYHDKIFQIFQTLTSRDEHESTGIGLTLVKKIIVLYGGSVWVESETGHGATFFFTLPKQGEKDGNI